MAISVTGYGVHWSFDGVETHGPLSHEFYAIEADIRSATPTTASRRAPSSHRDNSTLPDLRNSPGIGWDLVGQYRNIMGYSGWDLVGYTGDNTGILWDIAGYYGIQPPPEGITSDRGAGRGYR